MKTKLLHKETICPTCKKVLDSTTGETDDPQPGDWSICIKCATPLIFEENFTQRKASPEDIKDLRENNEQSYRTLMMYMQTIKQMHYGKR